MGTFRRAIAPCSRYASYATVYCASAHSSRAGHADVRAIRRRHLHSEGHAALQKSTRVRYEALLRQGLLDHFGALPLGQVAEGVVGYAGELVRRKVQAKGAMHLRQHNPACGSRCRNSSAMPRIPRVWKEPKKLPDAPPLETVERLIGGTSRWIGLAIALAAYAGMRSGEVRALQARHVDLERGVIMIKQSFSEDEVDLPKSWQRVVPIAQPLRPALERAMRDKRPRDFMVTNSKGKTPTRQAIFNRLVGLEPPRDRALDLSPDASRVLHHVADPRRDGGGGSPPRRSHRSRIDSPLRSRNGDGAEERGGSPRR